MYNFIVGSFSSYIYRLAYLYPASLSGIFFPRQNLTDSKIIRLFSIYVVSAKVTFFPIRKIIYPKKHSAVTKTVTSLLASGHPCGARFSTYVLPVIAHNKVYIPCRPATSGKHSVSQSRSHNLQLSLHFMLITKTGASLTYIKKKAVFMF